MPLRKFVFKPGINRENTRYTTEGGWYDGDKVRFRQGSPESIGGWQRISNNTFQGVCRSLRNWVSLEGVNYTGVPTHLKVYIEQGGAYYDVTPIRETQALTDPFDTTISSSIVTVTDTAHGAIDGDFVTFSGATAVGGLTIDGEYQLTYVTANTYTIDAGSAATSTANGGGSVTANYQINVGPSYATPIAGWSASYWGSGTWGVGQGSNEPMRLWSQANFGEDLVLAQRNGALYYWDTSAGTGTRAVLVSSLGGASDVPVELNYVVSSDISRFVFALGANEIGSGTGDPMLVRWSDQENVANWTPAATNQAGSIRLSQGSQTVTATQARQEILVWTDTSLYSFQYVGAPIVWATQLVGENISIASPQAVAYTNGTAYWMGKDKFYMYDGRSQSLPCDVRRYVFGDFNTEQYGQVIAGTNEEFHEVWWFYCSDGSTTVDKYVVYNHAEGIWYYGNLARTAWLDSGIQQYPIAASYSGKLLYHEFGVDDKETTTTASINSYILSSEFDLDDGDRFMFINKVVPDIAFDASDITAATVTMTFYPLHDSGSGYNSPLSEGGNSTGNIVRSSSSPIDVYTAQLPVRLRGRQMAIKIEADTIGTAWQLGALRMNLRPDGRR